MKQLASSLMGNSTFDSLDNLNIKDKLLKIPKLDLEKFTAAKNEIIEYIKEKLKNLLDFHSIRFNDLSWVIISIRVSPTIALQNSRDACSLRRTY